MIKEKISVSDFSFNSLKEILELEDLTKNLMKPLSILLKRFSTKVCAKKIQIELTLSILLKRFNKIFQFFNEAWGILSILLKRFWEKVFPYTRVYVLSILLKRFFRPHFRQPYGCFLSILLKRFGLMSLSKDQKEGSFNSLKEILWKLFVQVLDFQSVSFNSLKEIHERIQLKGALLVTFNSLKEIQKRI